MKKELSETYISNEQAKQLVLSSMKKYHDDLIKQKIKKSNNTMSKESK